MITKEKAKEALAQMPDTFSVEELIERLIFFRKNRKGASTISGWSIEK
jgi:hypothetical protein